MGFVGAVFKTIALPAVVSPLKELAEPAPAEPKVTSCPL